MPVTIAWFRHDLRLADQPALQAAVRRGAVAPVYIWSPEEHGNWPPGGAARVFLHHALVGLNESLRKLGSRLIVRRGDSFEQLKQVAEAVGADEIYANRVYEPALAQRDAKLETKLAVDGIALELFDGSLLHQPEQLRTGQGDPYRVFSPFWKKFVDQIDVRKPLAKPRKLDGPKQWPDSLAFDDLGLLPDREWDEPIADCWATDEAGVTRRLKSFVKRADDYGEQRDRPDADGTSQLSAVLRWGLLSPHTIWHAVAEPMPRDADWKTNGHAAYLREIGWREFGYHLLHHFPHTPDKPLHRKFEKFAWTTDRKALRAWQHGQTGYPIVDAGMRQLWRIGWMHNRVRMIVASFLTKDLLIDWQDGAAWFWDTLVDADLANNTMGWQWAAGCGADAQPFFRIFNPVNQSLKFDPDGQYIRQWVPELAGLAGKSIHQPWEAAPMELAAAGVTLGEDYPRPMVDHAKARKQALAVFDRIK